MGRLVQALVVPCLCLWLASVLVPGVSSEACSKENCANEAFRCQKANEQCCKQHVGCLCDGSRYPGCDEFENNLIPIGHSIYIDFGNTKCDCKCNLELACASTCEEIPSTCKNTIQPQDGCLMCAD